MSIGLFIFRRDFRIFDNISLYALAEKCSKIFTVFIFTPEQVVSNKFKSDRAIQYMIESLEELSEHIKAAGGKLYLLQGENESIILSCIKALHITHIGYNLDYSPYALKRDSQIEHLSKKHGIELITDYDYYLLPPNQVLTGGKTAYKKFTPFYHACMSEKIPLPNDSKTTLTKVSTALSKTKDLPHELTFKQSYSKFVNLTSVEIKNMAFRGGRSEALKSLKQGVITQKKYDVIHNTAHMNTSRLSPYIKFGCISIREVYQEFKSNKPFIRQLIWRDFYANILYNYKVLGNAMQEKYNKLKWDNSKSWFKLWCEGNTGFPIVDAGMRELNISGYMHNRTRLIVASFLVKTLLISWEWGEKYFATRLIDYDPASNNGNWQWIASTGADSQQYFRIFNPMMQGKKFDTECIYIKKWIPELADLEPKLIHKWDLIWDKHKDIKYPKPMCDYSDQKKLTIAMYKKI